MSNKEQKDAVEYFSKLCDVQGASCLTVEDGHILMFKRSFLQELIDKNPDKEKVVIYLKRPEFKN